MQNIIYAEAIDGEINESAPIAEVDMDWVMINRLREAALRSARTETQQHKWMLDELLRNVQIIEA